MTSQAVAQRLRTFLLVMVIGMCVGTVVELWLAEHMESAIQYVPFVLCWLGFVAAIGALILPRRTTLLLLRWAMALVAVGGLFGMFEHFEHNLGFAQEIQPNAAMRDLLLDALKGANPLLAPGILTLTALLAMASTYYHPALEKR